MSTAAHLADSDLAQAVHDVAHMLPDQGPIDTFIHHNTLHAFEHLPFHDGLLAAHRELGVDVYLTEHEYREALRSGRIDLESFEAAIAASLVRIPAVFVSGDSRHAFRRALLMSALEERPVEALAWARAEGTLLEECKTLVRSVTLEGVADRSREWLNDELRATTRGASTARFVELIVGPGLEKKALRIAHNDKSERTLAQRFSVRSPPRSLSPSVSPPALRLSLPSVFDQATMGDVDRSDVLRAEQDVIADALAFGGLPTDFASLKDAIARADHRIAVAALWAAAVGVGDEGPVQGPRRSLDGPAKQRVDAFLVPHCAAFLDRGMAAISYPNRGKGFFRAFCALYTKRHFALPPWLDSLADDLRPSEPSEACLERLLHAEGLYTHDAKVTRLKSLALALPGWAGMFGWLERHGESAVFLQDFLAVRMLLERAAIRSDPELPTLAAERIVKRPLALLGAALHLGWTGQDLRRAILTSGASLTEELDRMGTLSRLRIWHDAFERAHAKEILGTLSARRRQPIAQSPAPDLQVVTCIDDREESFRRHLEELGGERVATYGSAGFFGIAMSYASLDDHAAVSQCPVVVTPSHSVHEHVVHEDASRGALRTSRRRSLALVAREVLVARTTPQGILASFLFAIPAMILLSFRVLFPRSTHRFFRALVRMSVPEVRTSLAVHRDPNEGPASASIEEGFSVREAIDRVAGNFTSSGLGPTLAPLVLFVAHGSSSRNNPHRSAYDCGACGGHGGAPNARIFARMANNPAVREGLKRLGFVLPEHFHLVGAYHDTTSDEVTYFDTESIPAPLAEAFRRAQSLVDDARKRSAHERCRRFASANPNLSFDEALHHAEGRAADLGEARPELGHATNAVCVIGRRSLTRGVFLDRRALLVSYDATQDPTGDVLTQVMDAALPVCAGINLEYYFSRVDPDRLGAGTKLPHNVAAHLGVVDGAVGDLRTGLPRQMTELHEAVRLLTIIEAPLAIAERVLSANPGLSLLWRGGWVRVVVVDPATGFMSEWNVDEARFEPASLAFAPHEAPDSFTYYRGHDEHLRPALISANGAAAHG